MNGTTASTSLLALACCGAALAQGAAPAKPDGAASEPRIQRIVIEDEAVRIDELRVRGQTQRIVVTPKNSRAGAYEIVPAAGGSDPSQPRGSAGQRQWSLWSF